MRTPAPHPLYNFLAHCNRSPLDRVVLDCGAGGPNPPLALFYEQGYRTCGVEISESQLAEAGRYCRENNMDLNIVLGDMRRLPFGDASFSFLFSHNTSVHMRKRDFTEALREFARVLRPGGLCYVNFLGHGCDTFGRGVPLGPGEFACREDGEEILFVHYEDAEPEALFGGLDVVYRERRTVERMGHGAVHRSCFLDYILQRRRGQPL